MDMDLWWCPVCERAITENRETPMDLTKRTSNPASSARYSGRGGVYGPQESLYCSEACRQVEELNGRFAFEQLAACLPVFCDRTSSEEPESEGTLSGTDEPNTDRSRSLSLGRRSESATASQRTSTSSSFDINLANPEKPKAANQPIASKEPSLEVRSTARRVPILLSPNGTPLVQPIFPQRPALAPHQRRHYSQLSPVKRSSLYTTAVARMAHTFKPSGRPAGNPSNSVPTYPPSIVGQRGAANRTRSILNTASTTRDDMEFGAEARREKPTYLWRHYGLFYRPRPGSRREEWVECSSPTEMEHDRIPNHERNLVAVNRQASRAGSYKKNSGTKQYESKSDEFQQENKRVVGAPDQEKPRVPRISMMTDGNSTQEIVEASKFLSKSRRSLLGESKCSRSWSWDHLPADVPQYPAMDLEQIRVSKLIREQKLLGGHQNSTDLTGSQLKARPVSQLSVENSSVTTIIPSSKVPIQTKKKLFVFQ